MTPNPPATTPPATTPPVPSPPKTPPPRDFGDVLAAELEELRARRRALFPGQSQLSGDESAHPHTYAGAHRLRPLGLCFSGGGIRSATFNLGVLQGLAELGLLPFIDYLSTVSGGGYIAAWLHGLIRNKHQGDPICAQGELHPRRVPGEPDQDPVTFLRKYSNYLAPQPGLFSPDFWTIGAVWLRNMSLNLIILIPFLMAVVLAVLLSGVLQQTYGGDFGIKDARNSWVVALILAVFVIGCNLRQIVFIQFPELKPRIRLPDLSGRFMVGGASACIIFASYILGAFRFAPHPERSAVVLFLLFAALQWIGGFRLCYRARHKGASGWLYLIGIPLLCAMLTSALLLVVSRITGAWRTPDVEWLRIAFGPPLVLVVWMCGTTLQIGLMGSDFPDAAREWLARLGASVSIGMAGWVGLFIIAVFGPYWLVWATLNWAPAGGLLIGGWISSAIGGYLSGKSSKAAGEPNEQADTRTRAMELLATVSPAVFLAGFLLFVSAGTQFCTHTMLRKLAGTQVGNYVHLPAVDVSSKPRSDCVVPITHPIPEWLLWLEPVQRQYWCFLHYDNYNLLFAIAVLLAACLATIGVLPLRFNINEFSMHHFYKNRLVRCYLGASRAGVRKPNRLTGFDPFDDFPLAALVPSDPLLSYLGPYQIVNCALNLNTGSELAKQERHGDSFVFTPRFCGFDPPQSREDRAVTRRTGDLNPDGYRATRGYMEPAGPGLGTTIAISGAAANPNSGYHTSAPLAFLMTILNVRLGWWLGNPRRDAPSARPGPKNALLSLLSELFAQSNGRSRYVNVSDGGHFENLGLYELVRRRCRYIIVCDSEADPDLVFEGLGGAIRKCRADFGVEIALAPESIHRVNGLSRAHCVLGTITYPEPEAGFAADSCGRPEVPTSIRATGWLLYLKSSLTGDEPEDVQQYHSGHPPFPHESTANQFFSESQFESYRQLGLHVVRTTFENVATRPSPMDQQPMLAMFQDLCRKWYPAPAFGAGAVTNLTEQYSAFVRRVAEDPELAFLDNQLFSGMPPVDQPEVTPRKAVYFCMELIQLMEDTYFQLNLQHRGDRENPMYAGWGEILRTWAGSRAVQDAWKVAGNGFSPMFREFFENLSKPKDSSTHRVSRKV